MLFLLFCPCALPCDLSFCLISGCAWGVVFAVMLTAVLKRVCEPKDASCVVASHICLPPPLVCLLSSVVVFGAWYWLMLL